jgi:hypothetical protein
MLKETITYVDYEGVERTEAFYFNLTQAEVTEMELSIDGGLVKKIEKIVAAQDGAEIIRLFKEIILSAYGEKSPDGRRFVKSHELSQGFSQTEAYSQLFMRLATNADEAARFIKGITPQEKTV